MAGEALPYDETAEACALLAALADPSLLRRAEFEPLIVSGWRMRAFLRALVETDRRNREQDVGAFFGAWTRVLCEQECGSHAIQQRKTSSGEPWHEHWEPLRCVARDAYERARALEEASLTTTVFDANFGLVCALDGHGPHKVLTHTIDFWLERLALVRQARSLVELAQGMAEHAWKLDSAGARRLASLGATVTHSMRSLTERPLEPTPSPTLEQLLDLDGD